MSICLNDSTAYIEDRLRRLCDQRCCVGDCLRFWLHSWLVTCQVNGGWPVVRCQLLQSIFSNVYKNWARATGRCNMESLSDNAWDLCWVCHQIVVLGKWHSDAANICFLECIGTDCSRWNLASDSNKWN